MTRVRGSSGSNPHSPGSPPCWPRSDRRGATSGVVKPVASRSPRGPFASGPARVGHRPPSRWCSRVPTGVEAERSRRPARFLAPTRFEIVPAWETPAFERVSPATETMGRRQGRESAASRSASTPVGTASTPPDGGGGRASFARTGRARAPGPRRATDAAGRRPRRSDRHQHGGEPGSAVEPWNLGTRVDAGRGRVPGVPETKSDRNRARSVSGDVVMIAACSSGLLIMHRCAASKSMTRNQPVRRKRQLSSDDACVVQGAHPGAGIGVRSGDRSTGSVSSPGASGTIRSNSHANGRPSRSLPHGPWPSPRENARARRSRDWRVRRPGARRAMCRRNSCRARN